MKIYKGQYGYYTTCNNSKDKERKCYLDIGFKMGTEPTFDDYEVELIARDRFGNERKCFFTNYPKKDGSVQPKLMMMGEEQNTGKTEGFGGDVSVYDPKTQELDTEKFGKTFAEIKSEDLPFY